MELKHAIERMKACVTDMLRWLLANNLSLNASKSELLLFGTRKQQVKIYRSAVIHIRDSAIYNSDSARNLGVQLGSTLLFYEHVNNVCHNCYLHIICLAHICRYLTIHSVAVLGAAIVASKLDYCNSLLRGTTAANIGRLQRAQNRSLRKV